MFCDHLDKPVSVIPCNAPVVLSLLLYLVMMMKLTALVLAMAAIARCQRPSYAGFRPIGYPEIISTPAVGLADRFGEADATTQRLPVEALGDRDLVDRLSKLPIDKQPFWFINWQAIEANKEKPQTFPQKPNTFIDPIIPVNTNAGNIVPNQNLGTNGNLGVGTPSSESFVPNQNLGTNSGNFVNPNSGTLSGNSNSDTPHVNSGSSVPINSNTPSVSNIISANANAGSTAALEDRFSGGIALNRFPENESTSIVNHKPGNL